MAARENRLHLESLQQLRKGDREEEKAAMERSQKRKEVQKYQLAQVKRRQEERAEMLEGINRINNPNLGKIIQFLEQRLEGEETKLITEEHNQGGISRFKRSDWIVLSGVLIGYLDQLEIPTSKKTKAATK